jgi:hypothetical protein
VRRIPIGADIGDIGRGVEIEVNLAEREWRISHRSVPFNLQGLRENTFSLRQHGTFLLLAIIFRSTSEK